MTGRSGSVVGIDFGTSTSLVAEKAGDASAEVYPLGAGTTFLPSLAAYDDGAFIVGEEADNHEHVARSVKRAITDNRVLERLGPPEDPLDLAADDVIVAILEEVVRRAGRLSPADHPRVRLGCPAMWDGPQRHRLLGLAARAGLRLTLADLVDEPVAAGIAWLARQRTRPRGRVLVFDMGGGTLDLAVLDVGDGRDVSVLAAIGVAEAGDSLDQAIAVDLEAELGRSGVDVSGLDRPARARDRLRYAARDAKVALSEAGVDSHPVALPRRLFGVPTVWYGRAQLEEVFAPQLDRALHFVWAALRTARLTERLAGSTYDIMRLPPAELARDVSAVVLAGGMSRIPYVATRLRAVFAEPCVIEPALDAPDEAVVVGLADSARYGRINMFRPGFDVVIEWKGGDERRTLYEAFTPLYEHWQIAQGGSDLCYRRTGLDLALPRAGEGRLRAFTASGERVAAGLDGRLLDGFPVALSEQKFDFRIYCDGRIRLTDADGVYEGHVNGWQAIRGRDHAEREDRRRYVPEPDVPLYYPHDRERN